MEGIHKQLTKTSRWYSNWHNHSHHKHIHWLTFLVISLILTSFLSGQIQNISYDFSSTAYAQSSNIGISGTRFTVGGQQKFLVLASYFDGIEASNLSADLNYFQSKGIDGVRVFPNWWGTCCSNPSFGDPLMRSDGTLKATKLNALKNLITQAQARGMVVDVSFARETVSGSCSQGGFQMMCEPEYVDGVVATIIALSSYSNVIFDIQNEGDGGITFLSDPSRRSIRDQVRAAVSGTILSMSGSNGVTAGTTMANIANQYNFNFTNVHHTNQTDSSNINRIVSDALSIASKPVYLGEPWHTTNVGGSVSSTDMINIMTAAKAAGAAAVVLHQDAAWNLNNSSFQSNLSGTESTAFNNFRSAVDSTSWGTGGGGGGSGGGTGGGCIDAVPSSSVVPNMKSVVDQVAAQHPDWLRSSCTDFRFLDEVVRLLRQQSTRWAYNCKRGNCNDPWREGIAYYYGTNPPPAAGSMENYEVFAVDIAHQDCANPSATTTDWIVADWPNNPPGTFNVAYLYPRTAGGSLPSPVMCSGGGGGSPPAPPPGGGGGGGQGNTGGGGSGVISGKVTDQCGSPVSGVEIGFGSGTRALTDSQGNWSATGLSRDDRFFVNAISSTFPQGYSDPKDALNSSSSCSEQTRYSDQVFGFGCSNSNFSHLCTQVEIQCDKGNSFDNLFDFEITRSAGCGGSGTPPPPPGGIPPTSPPGPASLPSSSIIVEAEDFDSNNPAGGHSWVSRSSFSGYSGTGYMVAEPDNNLSGSGTIATWSGVTPEMTYQVNFPNSGTYNVFFRARFDTNRSIGSSADSFHIGVNGNYNISPGVCITNEPAMLLGNFYWLNSSTNCSLNATINIPSPGVHTINIRMREDGTTLDAFGFDYIPPGGTFPPPPGPASLPPPPSLPPTTLSMWPNPIQHGETLEVYGTNLVHNFQFTDAGGSVTNISGWVDQNYTVATVTIPNSLLPGDYTVTITGPAGSATVPGTLTVQGGGSSSIFPQSIGALSLPSATDFQTLISSVFDYAVYVVGIAVFIMIMWGGFLYMTSAANPGNIATAKKVITNALIGAVLLISAYVILFTINPELVGGTFNLPGIQAPVATQQCPGSNPVEICNVNYLNATDTSVTIYWNTNVDSFGAVNYWLNPITTQTSQITPVGTTHTIIISGLTPGTQYNFNVQATLAAGGYVAMSPDMTFTTARGTGSTACAASQANATNLINAIGISSFSTNSAPPNGCGINFNPQQNIQDMAAGLCPDVCSPACLTSTPACVPGGSNGSVAVNPIILQGLINYAGARGEPYIVTSFTTGVHSATSAHYTGNAVDIYIPNLSASTWRDARDLLQGSVQGSQAFCEIGGTIIPACDDFSSGAHIHWEL